MSLSERRQPLKVEVPSAKDETPRLARVGLIALAGFCVGILWPRLAGFQLVPNPPGEQSEAEAAEESTAASSKPKKKAAPAPAKKSAEKKVAPADWIKVAKSEITSCRDRDGRDQRNCDDIDQDAIIGDRLLALAGCKAAKGVQGTLSIGFDVNFEKNKFERFRSGQSTDLPKSTAVGLIDCAEQEFESASLKGAKHQHNDYTIFTVLEFAPSPEAVAATDKEKGIVAASGRATVSWRVALIREKPDQESKRVARLLSGTRVVVTGRKGDWYRVKYDSDDNEGWVFGGAIGLE